VSERKYSFDPKCLELADYFLPGGTSRDLRWDLAQTIQDAVELYIDVQIAERMADLGELSTKQ
jgi:hypothetical protein